MSQFSRQGQNLSWLGLELIIVWRVVYLMTKANIWQKNIVPYFYSEYFEPRLNDYIRQAKTISAKRPCVDFTVWHWNFSQKIRDTLIKGYNQMKKKHGYAWSVDGPEVFTSTLNCKKNLKYVLMKTGPGNLLEQRVIENRLAIYSWTWKSFNISYSTGKSTWIERILLLSTFVA